MSKIHKTICVPLVQKCILKTVATKFAFTGCPKIIEIGQFCLKVGLERRIISSYTSFGGCQSQKYSRLNVKTTDQMEPSPNIWNHSEYFQYYTINFKISMQISAAFSLLFEFSRLAKRYYRFSPATMAFLKFSGL